MRKILALFLTVSLLACMLAACNNTEQTSAPTESTVTTVTQTTVATTTTQAVTTTPLLYTEYTIATSEEPAEIQAKIDRNSLNKWIPSKVIITCGEERDVPYLVVGMGQYYRSLDSDRRGKVILDGWVSFGASRFIANTAIVNHGDELPVFHCSSLDELAVYVNDRKEYTTESDFIFINENGEEIEYNGSGRYYAYCTVNCLGPNIMQNEEVYDRQSVLYAVVFIVEITE